MKRSYLTIIILIFNTALLAAQTKNLNLDEIAAHISNEFLINYKPDSTALLKTCRRGFIFIKFNVNKQGKVSNLVFTKDSTWFIKAALKDAIYSIENDIVLVNTLKASGKTIILPFLYMYQSACGFPQISLSATAEERANFNRSYLTILLSMDHIDDAASGILTFNDKRNRFVDGIILEPIIVSTGSME